MALPQTAQDMVTACQNVNVRATMDPRKVNPPCVLITPPDLENVTACGVFAAWTVHLIAPGTPDLDAIAWLMDNVMPVFDAVGGYTAEFGNLTLSPDGDPMPAYTITVVQQPF